MNNYLEPETHKQRDFFTCDVFDTYKDDTASMEHPVFSLSTKPDFRMLVYKNNDSTIKIKPSYTGLATIHDKDILLYLASSLMNAKNNGEKIHQVVRFVAYDYMISTNKKTSGVQYQQLKDGLSRLKGTVIETNIKTNGTEITREFSLIDEWGVIKEDNKGKMVAVEVKLSYQIGFLVPLWAMLFLVLIKAILSLGNQQSDGYMSLLVNTVVIRLFGKLSWKISKVN